MPTSEVKRRNRTVWMSGLIVILEIIK